MTMNELADHAQDMKPPLQLPRRRFFNDMPDKGLFGVVALVGFAAIFGLKSYGLNPDVIAALAVVIMIIYGACAYHMPAVGMRPDRLGDNFYYLGFIYTLASLSAAIFQMRAGVDIDQLLGSFGIALVTTIVGIAGRVMFVQLRGDLDDIEEAVRRDLAATSSQLRAQLSASVREFETLRTSLVQSLQETTDACAQVSKKQVDQIDELARSASKQIDTAFEANRALANRLAQAMQSIAKTAELINKRTAAIELPSETLNAQLADFAKGQEALLLRLAATIDEVAQRSVPRRRWNWPFGAVRATRQ